MAGKNKKKAAALAAVSLFLEQEEAAALEEQQAAVPKAGGAQYSAWGHSGRHEMMTMRRLIQLRTFTRF
ncbi:hypothetical protein [Desulforhopalus singaporensis]|uniref:Uncharacterized protein n=1 Tax=Desulforhopalus singaporensis TaxID=91360 RepID=A0A1H0MJR9_9BACT|nr:hypothetical protein [Desulforhopalus singaporensis]SDO80698.1 hypothetical protein SAMN05660330_01080 [Desulforhopalus singaporensis]